MQNNYEIKYVGKSRDLHCTQLTHNGEFTGVNVVGANKERTIKMASLVRDMFQSLTEAAPPVKN